MIPTQDSNCIHWRYLSSTCACLYWSQFFGGEQYLSIKTNGSETGIEIGQNSLSAQALSKTCISGDCAHTGPKPGLWVSPFTHTFIFPVQVTVCKGLYSPQDLNHRHKGYWGLSLWTRCCRADMKITSHCFRQGAKTYIPSSCRSSEHVPLPSKSKATSKALFFKI